jgi:hypothetical protein
MGEPVSIDMTAPKKARIIKASRMLQAKIGMGPLDERTVERCQKVMDSNTYDFSPLAEQYLNRLAETIERAKKGTISKGRAVELMTETVMQLKANASMFRYGLVGKLANIMLGFLESVDDIDPLVIEIVEAHHKTLKAIVSNKLEGDGGTHGQRLETELKEAMKRYFARKKV